MKLQPLRIGVASIIAATMIGTGLAAPKADAASEIRIITNTQYLNYTTLNQIAQKYGIDLSKLNFNFNGITINWPTPAPTAKPTVTPAPTAKPTVTPAPTAKPTATPAPTAKPTATPAPTAKPTATPAPTTTAPAASTIQQQVVTLVNQERAKLGLPALQMDTLLNKVATEKARDMDVNNYFSHTSPTYGSPFDMMKSFGVKYSYAGENIASGQPTAARVMSDWMNSPGHRANIVSPNFTKIGVGYVNGEWVQMFIG
ncbi:CAP domain-containing protein [Paenibacillus soyae]|uniref:CAP domain-containing protein n=1 Tax=Paenibacillus soyae TaxID=2969249 RepID=A0A9X2MTS4_9BACL|nr:CAP domain-containing protein [Paenibacillus soyae]MCR2806162.1 CAP domain-containing protein [Paenibacillus soyae]